MRSTRPPLSVFLALLVATVAVSMAAVLIRMAGTPPLVTAAARMAIAALIVAPIGLWRGWDELRALPRRELGLLALSGLFLALHFATWISSLELTSVASSVVLVTTNPLWVALFALFRGERLTRSLGFGILLATLGGVIVGVGDTVLAGQSVMEMGSRALLGDLLALLGAVAAALYLTAGGSARQRLGLWPYVSVVYSVAAVLLLGMLWLSGGSLRGVVGPDGQITPFDARTYGMLFLVAAVPQLIGHTAYNYALGWLSAGFIAVALLAEPVGATILAAMLLDEPVTVAKTLGGALILYGIFLATRSELPTSAPTEAPGERGMEL